MVHLCTLIPKMIHYVLLHKFGHSALKAYLTQCFKGYNFNLENLFQNQTFIFQLLKRQNRSNCSSVKVSLQYNYKKKIYFRLRFIFFLKRMKNSFMWAAIICRVVQNNFN